MSTSGAYTNLPGNVVFTAEESQRVKAFILRIGGVAIARKYLGVSEHTLNAARFQGRMQGKTRDRLLAAIEAFGTFEAKP